MDDDERMTLLRHELEAAKEAAENDQLDGVGMALRAVIAHLRREGIEWSLLHLLDVRLLGALADTGVGKSHPLLLKRKRGEKGGRPPISNEAARLMATGAAYMDCAIRAGVPATEAAKNAAEIIAPQLGADPRIGRHIDAKTMMRFRHKLCGAGAAAGKEHKQAKTIYDMLQEERKSSPWPDDEAAARFLSLLRNTS